MIRGLVAWARTEQSYRLMARAHLAVATIAVVLGVIAAVAEQHINLNVFLWLPVAIGLFRSREWALDLTKGLSWLGLIAGPIMLVLVLAWPDSDINAFGFTTGNVALIAALLVPSTLLCAWTVLAINKESRRRALGEHYAKEATRT